MQSRIRILGIVEVSPLGQDRRQTVVNGVLFLDDKVHRHGLQGVDDQVDHNQDHAEDQHVQGEIDSESGHQEVPDDPVPDGDYVYCVLPTTRKEVFEHAVEVSGDDVEEVGWDSKKDRPHRYLGHCNIKQH